jgi:methylation protein EvaC
MAACLVCNTALDPFMSFGQQPIANGFLTPEEFPSEYFFELKVAFCPSCTMVQLTELVDREKMFHDHYAFFSSTSSRMAAHFADFAAWVRTNYLTGPDPLVVEIGSNDGIMLRHFADARIRHIGIEPSTNVAAVARERGINTVSEFFDESLAKRLVAEHGHADAFLAANVMCHIPDLHSVAKGIRTLLKPTGIAAFEDPYLGDVIRKTAYDQIYDEHVFLFSVSSIDHLFSRHDMELIDVIPQDVHGGSMRYIVAHRGSKPVSDRVARQRAIEHELGLSRPQTYEQFRRQCEQSRDALVALLEEQKMKGRRVVGYAATSKSTTVTNYCGITPELVEFISDTTPIKQGKYSPGVHIPVRPYDEFVRDYPDLALLFGWNHADEIMAKEQRFRDAGGRWIMYVPKVQVVA